VCLILGGVANGQTGVEELTKVYGGHDATNAQFPFVVLHVARSSQGVGTCTGSLITVQWVLLAAHCVKQSANTPNNHLVAAGKADMRGYLNRRQRVPFQTPVNYQDVQERRAAAVLFHPGYTNAYIHDVALIRVSKPFVLTPKVGVVAVTRAPFPPQAMCGIIGYGASEGDRYRYIQEYVPNMPARAAPNCLYQRNKDVICLVDKSRGICNGDSGGPMICGGVLTGVASHGLYRDSTGCGTNGTLEQYYTDIFQNLHWMRAVFHNLTFEAPVTHSK